jgi:hypothetical protein
MNRPDDWADYLDPDAGDPALPPSEREALDRIIGTLATADVWGEPPAGLRASLLERAAAESAARGPRPSTPDLLTEPGTEPSLPAPQRLPAPRGRSGRRGWWLSAVGVAAAAALAAVVAWPRPETTTFAMAGTELAPAASATAELEAKSAGVAIVLEIKGLKPARAGTYYAAWMRGPAGVVPVGTFHWHKGGIPIDLWSGVPGDKYPELFVTVQHEGEPPDPSAEVVLIGTVG